MLLSRNMEETIERANPVETPIFESQLPHVHLEKAHLGHVAARQLEHRGGDINTGHAEPSIDQEPRDRDACPTTGINNITAG